ncbi:MAG: hypothetical protein LLF94_06330 [Chlamydiales bacterium]|nr:hypothetical protein [Chlamydiales bacterium]
MLRIFILFISISSMLIAGDFRANERIFRLLPSLDVPLAIEPALPANFVALSKEGTLDLKDWVYWGPESVVKAYFNDPSSLKQSIIRVRLSETVKQIGPEKFSSENDELCKLMAPMGLKRLFDVRMKWGKYPIYAITAEFQKKWLYTAWVGLSDPQGTTLMFELIYPGVKPSQENFDLWDRFLDKSCLLSESVVAQAFKVEYKPGVTDVVLYGENLSVVGEQRYSDKLIQVVVDTKKSGYKPVLDTVYLAHINPDATCGGAGAKVYVSFVTKDNKTYTHMLPVLIKAVDTFSVDAKLAKDRGDVVYEQELPCMLKEYLR